jgi:hypothetical protein
LEKTLSKGIHLELESIIEFANDGIVSKTLVKSGAKEVSMFCMSAGQSLYSYIKFPRDHSYSAGQRQGDAGSDQV